MTTTKDTFKTPQELLSTLRLLDDKLVALVSLPDKTRHLLFHSMTPGEGTEFIGLSALICAQLGVLSGKFSVDELKRLSRTASTT
jgi:hypothetical protein